MTAEEIGQYVHWQTLLIKTGSRMSRLRIEARYRPFPGWWRENMHHLSEASLEDPFKRLTSEELAEFRRLFDEHKEARESLAELLKGVQARVTDEGNHGSASSSF